LMAENLRLPATRKITVRIVLNVPYPLARRLAAWNSPLMASRKPLV
jgi:hypothetical protein